MKKRTCKKCSGPIKPRSQNKGQRYCSKTCGKERKRLHQAKKRAEDPDYRENDRQASREFRKENPGYMKDYRERNPDYVEKNRSAQRRRNQRRREAEKASQGPSKNKPMNPIEETGSATESRGDCEAGIVNVDASIRYRSEIKGFVEVLQTGSGSEAKIVNVDVSMVQSLVFKKVTDSLAGIVNVDVLGESKVVGLGLGHEDICPEHPRNRAPPTHTLL